MRSEIASAMLMLARKRSLPNPITLMGLKVSYFGDKQLRHLFRELFEKGSYLFHTQSSRPFILDCGSNIGMSVLFFKKLWPNARIIGFEPDPTTFAVLRTNITQNRLTDITLHQCALSDTDGTIEFYRSSQLNGSLLMSAHHQRGGDDALLVPARRLSSFVTEQVDLLKMDIEGCEEAVLTELAASGQLDLIRQIRLEYHHHIDTTIDRLGVVLRLLEGHGFGYQLSSAHPSHSLGEVFQDISIYCYRKG